MAYMQTDVKGCNLIAAVSPAAFYAWTAEFLQASSQGSDVQEMPWHMS